HGCSRPGGAGRPTGTVPVSGPVAGAPSGGAGVVPSAGRGRLHRLPGSTTDRWDGHAVHRDEAGLVSVGSRLMHAREAVAPERTGRVETVIRPRLPVDLRLTLWSLGRGARDRSVRADRDGAWWRTPRAPQGP